MKVKAIGLLGGTFDPIHLGHLRMALELFESLSLERVHFIPSHQSVHRDQPIASAAQRLKMVELAIQDQPKFVADDCEIRRGGASYTIDTLSEIRKTITQPLYLLMAMDAFAGFTQWRQFEKILEQVHLIVAYRPGYAIPQTSEITQLLSTRGIANKADLLKTSAGSILLQPVTALEISAAAIREQYATGHSSQYLLHNTVFEYLKTNKIYR